MIPFNKPYLTGKELKYIEDAHSRGHLAGDGAYTKLCQQWLEENLNCKKVLLTHSCTAALEMSCLLLDISRGDEVIMPSFTFVSTANAFSLQGAKPVFADIDPITLNIDIGHVESLINERTKAIVPVHYAGVACDMSKLTELADKHGIKLVEDAAQAILAKHEDKFLGTIGDLGTLSFHETKNIISGEGGALLINEDDLLKRAEIIREKGTNRSAFFRGETDKYSWVDIGSSYLPSELIAAFLLAQLEKAFELTASRKKIWNSYHKAFEELEFEGMADRPKFGGGREDNSHIYYLLLPTEEKRNAFISKMKNDGVHCVFHYLPLHNSEYSRKLNLDQGPLVQTERVSSRLVRLPIWQGIESHQSEIIEKAYKNIRSLD